MVISTKFRAKPSVTDFGTIYLAKNQFEAFKKEYPNLKYAILVKKDYSTCVKIGEIKEDPVSKHSYITFNQEKKGTINANDEIELFSFSSRIAKNCILLLNDRYTVPEGDWGSKIVNPSVEGDVFDYGDTLDFFYGEENPMLIHGILKVSSPPAPVIIGPHTYFSIEKSDQAAITKEESKSHDLKKKRAKEFSELQEEKILSLVDDIRANAIDSKMATYSFEQVNPSSIFNSLKKVLFNYKIISESVNQESDNFTGSFLATPFSKKPDSLIEIRIFANIKKGNITVSCYSSIRDNAYKILEKDINPLLPHIIDGLKETSQLLYDLCAGCNGKLKIDTQDDKGIVKCHYCKTLNQLPIDLRNNIEIATLDVVEDLYHTEINDLVIKEVEMFLKNINPGIQVPLDQISKKIGIKKSKVKPILSQIISENNGIGEYIEEIDSFLRKQMELKTSPEDFTNYLKEMESKRRKR